MARPYVTAAVVMIFILVDAAPKVDSAITCQQLWEWTSPCVTYVGRGGQITPCCNGIKAVAAATNTRNDRRTVCRCLKASAVSNVPYDTPAKLCKKCGVKVPYGVTPLPTTNCNTIP